MLPPVEASTLAANPKFEALYNDLSTQKLNADGTSKYTDPKIVKDREAFAEDLHKARKDAELKRIVQDGLLHLATRVSELPDELRELSAVVLATLRHEIPDEDKEIIEIEINKFKHEDKITPIATAFSKHIQADALGLAKLLESDTSDPNIPQLPVKIQSLQQDLLTSRHSLAQTRITLGNDTRTIHTLYRDTLETSIRLLEQIIHGSLSRATRAKADYLATVAEGMAGKLGVQRATLLQHVYTPELQSVLKVRIGETEQQKIQLRRKIREAEEELERYRGVKGAGDMAGEYAKVMGEVERVKGEIHRLEIG